MAYWTGLVLFAIGGWLAWAGLAHRRRALALRGPAAAGAPAARADPRSLAAFGEIMRPVILFALAYLGVKTALAFWWLDAGRYLSLFDLAGFLFLLAGYGTWMVLKTKYPALPPAAAPVPAPAENVLSLQEERARRGHEPAGLPGAVHRPGLRRGLGDT
ncbi:MAG: hypothetical protein ACOZDY_15335 [Pseudomonadota bacterium]